MESSQFSIKILAVNFGNCILNNPNWDKISGDIKKTIFGTEWDCLWEVKKISVCQILLSKLCCTGQVYTIPKYIKKEIERIYDFLLNEKKYDLLGTYNHVHNILRLFDCGADFPFTTSDMKRDY